MRLGEEGEQRKYPREERRDKEKRKANIYSSVTVGSLYRWFLLIGLPSKRLLVEAYCRLRGSAYTMEASKRPSNVDRFRLHMLINRAVARIGWCWASAQAGWRGRGVAQPRPTQKDDRPAETAATGTATKGTRPALGACQPRRDDQKKKKT